MAADQGNMEGQWNYGTCLLNGTRVPPDHAEGARYLKLAADQGYADAQPDYVKCLLDGKGVPLNVKRDMRYLTMAVNQRHDEAVSKLMTLTFTTEVP